MSSADKVLLDRALNAYDNHDDAAAEPPLRSLSSRHPGNYVVNEALGSLYAEAGDAQRALPFLERAARLSPGEAAARANLGAAYLKLERGKEAVRELEASSRLNPRSPETQSSLGQALMLTKAPAQAAKAFQVAVSLNPSNADVTYDWALALYESNAFVEAESALKHIPQASMTGEAYSLFGDIEEKLGHYKEAVQQYQSAAQSDPSAANLYILTVELLRHWTWPEGLQVANFAAGRYPDDIRFRVAAGIALYGDSKYPQAASTFAALLAQSPTNEFYADLLGRSCSAAAEGVDSKDCTGLEQFAVAHPENARIGVFAATAILHNQSTPEDLTRAEQMLRHAAAADPTLPEAFYQLGVLAQQRSQWPESQASLEKAIQLRPEYAEAHYRLSRAYAHLNRLEDARRETALHQKYSQLDKDRLNARMQEIVKFLTKPS